LYACIRYESEQLGLAWIIAIIVVLAVPIIIILIVCVIGKWGRPTERKVVPPVSQVAPFPPLSLPYYTYAHSF